MRKRSQIQMGESIAVVIIVIIIIVIGILFWNRLRTEDLKDLQRIQEEMNVIEIAKIASELPELRCYNAGSVAKVNCFDWYKILAFNKTINDPNSHVAMTMFYNTYFGNSRITFNQVYPEEINITIYGSNQSIESTYPIRIPIIIEKNTGHKPMTSFGYIVVEGHYK